MKSMLLVFCGVSVLAGCSPKQAVEAPPPYNIEAPLNEVMSHIVDPAAQILWHSAGSVTTDKGEESLTPTTDAGWKAVDNAMTTVAEAGN
jgi:hypothetical protein